MHSQIVAILADRVSMVVSPWEDGPRLNSVNGGSPMTAGTRGAPLVEISASGAVAPQGSRRVFREDVVAGLNSDVTGIARVHCLFVGKRFEVFIKIRVTPTTRRGVLLGVLLQKLQVPVGCVSGNERLRLTKCFIVLF